MAATHLRRFLTRLSQSQSGHLPLRPANRRRKYRLSVLDFNHKKSESKPDFGRAFLMEGNNGHEATDNRQREP